MLSGTKEASDCKIACGSFIGDGRIEEGGIGVVVDTM